MLDLLMVPLLDGNSEIGEHVRSILCYLNCIRHLIRSRAVKNRVFFLKNTYFPLCVRNMYRVTIYYKSHGFTAKYSRSHGWIEIFKLPAVN